MDETLKASLDAIFDEAERKQAERAKAEQTQRETPDTFLTDFERAGKSTIQPALQEIVDYLRSRGQEAEATSRGVLTTEKRRPLVALYIFGDSVDTRVLDDYPVLRFVAEPSTHRIKVHMTTTGVGRRGGSSGDAGSMTLAEATKERVQSFARQFIIKLMRGGF